MSTLRDAVSQARNRVEESSRALEGPSQDVAQAVAQAVDEALDALDKLAGVLDEESAQAFLDSHFQIVHVDIPAPRSVPRKPRP